MKKIIVFLVCFCLAMILVIRFYPSSHQTTTVSDSKQNIQNPIEVLNSFYHLDQLQNKGYTGKGTHIAIVSQSPINMQHIDTFCSYYHIKKPIIKTINVDKPSFDNFKGHGEIDMDIQYAHVAAPDAEIDVYIGSNELDVFKRIAQDDIATVVTDSFENHYVYQDFQSNRQLINEYNDYLNIINVLNQQGTTVFAASGDEEGTPSNMHLDLPAILPNVISVGGSVIYIDPNKRELTENDWIDSTGGWTPFGRPSYQNGIAKLANIPNDARIHRLIPDITAVANEITIFTNSDIQDNKLSIFTDSQNGYNWHPAVGTSLSSPYVAGIFADISGGLEKRLGDIHPILYKSAGTSVFNKVQPISNSFFIGGAPYNLITGLGSVNPLETAKLFGLK